MLCSAPLYHNLPPLASPPLSRPVLSCPVLLPDVRRRECVRAERGALHGADGVPSVLRPAADGLPPRRSAGAASVCVASVCVPVWREGGRGVLPPWPCSFLLLMMWCVVSHVWWAVVCVSSIYMCVISFAIPASHDLVCPRQKINQWSVHISSNINVSLYISFYS